ncbi:hypothetical protein [Mesorhizobium onobrychidis]|uniref:hypothetical protein n=1 Tax=Mesorhizobium onobrychidis TaxID=2775404 RepID=UPI0035A93E9C
MMEFEADRMRHLALTDAVIVPERNVVLEERRSPVEDDLNQLLDEEMQATSSTILTGTRPDARHGTAQLRGRHSLL